MVLALSLPPGFAYRQLIVSMTFGVALLSILVHGATMSPVLRWLGIVGAETDRTDYEIRSGRVQAAAAALDRMSRMYVAAPEILDSLREEYGELIQSAEQEPSKLGVRRQQFYTHDVYRIRRLLAAERDQVMQALQQGAIGRQSQQQLLADIDARLLNLESGSAESISRQGSS